MQLELAVQLAGSGGQAGAALSAGRQRVASEAHALADTWGLLGMMIDR